MEPTLNSCKAMYFSDMEEYGCLCNAETFKRFKKKIIKIRRQLKVVMSANSLIDVIDYDNY